MPKNVALAYAVLDYIEANPERWDQEIWGCRSYACFAGWTTVLGQPDVKVKFPNFFASFLYRGKVRVDGTWTNVRLNAMELLGINDNEAGRLFYASNTFHSLVRLIREIFGDRPTTVTSQDEIDRDTVIAVLFDQVAEHQTAINEIKQQLVELQDINQKK